MLRINCSASGEDKHEDFSNQFLSVTKGKKEQVEIQPAKPFSYICLGEEKVEQITKEVCLPESIEAPVAVGEKVGTIEYSINGKNIGTIDLLTIDFVEKMAYFDCLEKMTYEFFLGIEEN